MTVIKTKFGDALLKARQSKGLSQEKLAAKANMSWRFYQEIERGKQQPTLSFIFELCKAIDMTPGEFLTPVWLEWIEEEK